MMMRILILSSLAAATALASTAASAQAPERNAEVTRTQAEERAGRAFDRIDANTDGQLDQADRAARQRVRFDRLDSDDNGALSFEEFGAPREKARVAARPAQRAERRASMAPLRSLMALGRRADQDGDGRIARGEFISAALARFDRADSDGNGTLTTEERRATRRGMRAGPAAS
jgi:hypothetical protein